MMSHCTDVIVWEIVFSYVLVQNKNIGKYNLPHIWDRIPFTIPELKLKK